MKRIFVCDDEEHILRLIQVNLEHKGCEVVTASNGREAKALLAESEFDMAVIDYVMPYADGIEVLDYLRNELKRDTRVVILSQEAGPELEERVEPYFNAVVVNQTGKTDWASLLDA